MTADIINISQARADRGQAQFIVCPHCGDESHFLPVVMGGQEGRLFISSLVCIGPACNGDGYTLTINNGYVT